MVTKMFSRQILDEKLGKEPPSQMALVPLLSHDSWSCVLLATAGSRIKLFEEELLGLFCSDLCSPLHR